MYSVYKLTDKNGLVYYGSSDSPETRFNRHKSNGNDCSSRKLDIDSMEMEIMKEDIATREEALWIERDYFDNNECVNEIRPILSEEEIINYNREYYEKNREELSIRKREYYEKNKEAVLKQKNVYRANHKEEICKKMREYYEKNREKVNKQTEAYRAINKEKINKQKKEYYEKNKEVRKEYYEKNKEQISKQRKEQYKRKKEIKLMGLEDK